MRLGKVSSYYIGVRSTASGAAQEGEDWHQFVARNLKGRLPPFLEEGMRRRLRGGLKTDSELE